MKMKHSEKVYIVKKALSEAQLNNPNIDLSGRRRSIVADMSMKMPEKSAPVTVPNKSKIPMMPDVIKRKAREAGKNKLSDLTGVSKGAIDGVGNLLNIAKKQRYDRDMFGGTMSLGRNNDFGSGGFGLSFSKDF